MALEPCTFKTTQLFRDFFMEIKLLDKLDSSNKMETITRDKLIETKLMAKEYFIKITSLTKASFIIIYFKEEQYNNL